MQTNKSYDLNLLNEAHFQIASTIHKLKETLKTLESKTEPKRYVSQITLAKRRIQTFEIALTLIQNEIETIKKD